MAGRESELYKDKIEVSLDGQQIFFLFFGGAVIATLVFVLGVMVGRRVEERSLAQQSELSQNPLAVLDQLEMGQGFAFPSSLRGEETTLGKVDSRFAEEIKEQQQVQVAAKSTSASTTSVDDTPSADKDESKEADALSPQEAKVHTPVPDISNKPISPKEAKAKTRRFTLQVGSFQKKDEAKDLVKSLAKDGFSAFTTEVTLNEKGTWYRVRLGHYDSYEAALEAKASFETKKQIIAYVTPLKK